MLFAIMATTLTCLLVHITFSTKYRQDLIAPAIEPDLYDYIGGICRARDTVLYEIGGTANHLHLFVSLGKTIAIADLLLNIKRDSSKLIKAKDPTLPDFAWQEGYFAFSVGYDAHGPLNQYIQNQKEHHKKQSFQDEMLERLHKYRVEYDPRYIWN